MAASMAAILPSHAVGVSPRGSICGNRNALPLLSISSFRRRHGSTAAGGSLNVRYQAENKPQNVESSSDVGFPGAPPIPSPLTRPKVKSMSLWDLLAFKGPAPERINGRLAMVGLVSALAVEVARGQDLAAQISDGGLLWFAGTAVVISAASLIPLLQGVDAPGRSNGFMAADAELWNGRLAMLGLVGLAFTEFLKGGPLV